MCCAKLTDEQRTIADMIFLNGYTHEQIANQLGYSTNTIKHKVQKLLGTL